MFMNPLTTKAYIKAISYLDSRYVEDHIHLSSLLDILSAEFNATSDQINIFVGKQFLFVHYRINEKIQISFTLLSHEVYNQGWYYFVDFKRSKGGIRSHNYPITLKKLGFLSLVCKHRTNPIARLLSKLGFHLYMATYKVLRLIRKNK